MARNRPDSRPPNGHDNGHQNRQDAAQDQLATRIQRQIQKIVGHHNVVVGIDKGAVYLSGRVPSAADKQMAQAIAVKLSDGMAVENDLEVERVLSEDRSAVASPDLGEGDFFSEVTGPEEMVGAINPEFTGQPLDTNVLDAEDSGVADQQPREADPTFFAPTDPVITFDEVGNLEVDNGFSPSSMTDVSIDPSTLDNTPGDEALVTAIQEELRQDALTTALSIDVVVENGVAHLRGTVPDLEDAENVEAVAARVPGVLSVSEELNLASE